MLRSPAPKFLIFAGSLTVSVLAARAFLAGREGNPVLLVDTHAEVAALLAERRSEVGNAVLAAGSGVLLREPIDEETARTLFPPLARGGRVRYDPRSYYFPTGPRRGWNRWGEHPEGGFEVRFNGLGLREDYEPGDTSPDWCVLLAGDSHMQGVVSNSESAANVLERGLRMAHPGLSIEVWNAGTGGYNFYHYLGTLERLAEELGPQVFVVVVYGGNDFSRTAHLQRYFHRRTAAGVRQYRAEDVVRAGRQQGPGLAQELCQVCYFLNNPRDFPIALETACAVTQEIVRQCERRGLRPVFAYLPPPGRGQPHLYAEDYRPALEILGLGLEELAVSDRLADGWLAFLRDTGVAHVDLRPIFRETQEELYWRRDLHLSVSGHRVLASALEALVRPPQDR